MVRWLCDEFRDNPELHGLPRALPSAEEEEEDDDDDDDEESEPAVTREWNECEEC